VYGSLGPVSGILPGRDGDGGLSFDPTEAPPLYPNLERSPWSSQLGRDIRHISLSHVAGMVVHPLVGRAGSGASRHKKGRGSTGAARKPSWIVLSAA
jgi:hypothetical protein